MTWIYDIFGKIISANDFIRKAKSLGENKVEIKYYDITKKSSSGEEITKYFIEASAANNPSLKYKTRSKVNWYDLTTENSEYTLCKSNAVDLALRIEKSDLKVKINNKSIKTLEEEIAFDSTYG